MKTLSQKESTEQQARRCAARRQIEIREELKEAGLELEDWLFVMGNEETQDCFN